MKRLAFLFILLALSLQACRTSSKARILCDVESYIQTQPDSALSTLSLIDTTSLTTPRLRAQYSLLYAMALDKNYIDTTDIRIIRPAVEYFQKHGSARKKMLSYYYEGRILFNGKRDSEAIISQMHALENAQNDAPDRYLGMIHTAIADLYIRSFCWEEALSYLKKAEKAFQDFGDTTSSYLIQERIAINYANQNDLATALHLLDSLLQSEQMPERLRPGFLMSKAGMMVDTAQIDYHPALECYWEAFEKGARPNIKQKSKYAYALAKSGFETESELLFSSLLNTSDVGLRQAGAWKQELLASRGEYEGAYKLLRERLSFQAEKVNQLLTQSLFRVQRDYFNTREIETALKNKNQKLIILILILSIFLAAGFIGFVITVLIRKARSKEIEMERLAETMGILLSEKEQSLSNLQAQFRQIHCEQFKLLEEYYKDYEIARRTGAGQKELYDKLLVIIKDIEGDTTGLHYLDSLIDQQYNGVSTRLHSECPALSNDEYRLFSYTAAGFDRSTIGMLLGNITADAIHMRRSRLRKTLKSLNPPSLQDFLAILDRR